ncbi:MAG TPA: transketolase [Polyangia bacterium]|jgi:transketolase
MAEDTRSALTARLTALARELRVDIIEMLAAAQSGHPGGSLSAIDVITTLFHAEMRHRPAEPAWPDRDRFVLSKGHAVPALYATLASCDYFPRAELAGLRKPDSRLQGHPANFLCPGVEASTGSLGQGLSVAIGMALAARLDRRETRVYCLCGDGEIEEGQVWEAAMAAAKYRLGNLCAVLDYNKGQIDGLVADVMPLEPVEDKWRAFGWHVRRIDGHDFEQIQDGFAAARKTPDQPTMLVADTIKGKGVSFMEGLAKWHGVAPTRDEAARAIAEIRRS